MFILHGGVGSTRDTGQKAFAGITGIVPGALVSDSPRSAASFKGVSNSDRMNGKEDSLMIHGRVQTQTFAHMIASPKSIPSANSLQNFNVSSGEGALVSANSGRALIDSGLSAATSGVAEASSANSGATAQIDTAMGDYQNLRGISTGLASDLGTAHTLADLQRKNERECWSEVNFFKARPMCGKELKEHLAMHESKVAGLLQADDAVSRLTSAVGRADTATADASNNVNVAHAIVGRTSDAVAGNARDASMYATLAASVGTGAPKAPAPTVAGSGNEQHSAVLGNNADTTRSGFNSVALGQNGRLTPLNVDKNSPLSGRVLGAKDGATGIAATLGAVTAPVTYNPAVTSSGAGNRTGISSRGVDGNAPVLGGARAVGALGSGTGGKLAA